MSQLQRIFTLDSLRKQIKQEDDMISEYDKKLLTNIGRKYILETVMKSKNIRNKLTFDKHLILCNKVMDLPYENVIDIIVNEDIRDFESKFSKFLKYGLAVIAGGTLVGSPAVGLLILYFYRKATDTCVKSCYNKMSLSKERKICKYECQLDAAKRTLNRIRSEIGKCGQTDNVEKCRKKLKKEYVKWNDRVRAILLKLNTAKMDQNEKQRKLNKQKNTEK